MKVGSVTEGGEAHDKAKRTGSASGAVRLAKLLRGIDAKGAGSPQ